MTFSKMVHYAGSRHLWTPPVNLGEICGRTEIIFVQHRHISSRDIQYYADKVRLFFCWHVQSLTKTSGHVWKVHAAKGNLLVDSTFGPPPLQYPFKWGADCVMHSGEQEWSINATQSVESGNTGRNQIFWRTLWPPLWSSSCQVVWRMVQGLNPYRWTEVVRLIFTA